MVDVLDHLNSVLRDPHSGRREGTLESCPVGVGKMT